VLSVIAKATELCNAGCVYCDVVRKPAAAVRTMTPQVLELLFLRVNEYLSEHPEGEVQIVWHGGEPLLAGPAFFKRARKLQQQHCAGNAHRVHHCMQTNLTLLTREFIEVLRSLGITSLGTSYEPLPGLRVLGKRADHKAYNRKFMNGLRLLEKEKFTWGMIYVVTRHSLERPLDLFYFLMNFQPQGQVMLNPVLLYQDQPDPLAITPSEYTDFLGAIFPTWWQHRDRYPNLEPFRSIGRNLVENSRLLACAETGSCHRTHVNLAPDGSLSLCGRSADWKLLEHGSIRDFSFTQALQHQDREVLRQRNRVLAERECRDCRFWEICHGGCPLDGWAESGNLLGRSPWGCARKNFIEKYFEPISGVCYRSEPPSVPQPGARHHTEDAVPSTPVNPLRLNLAVIKGGETWINPIGGLGDSLMLSGVLKQLIEADSSRKFNLVTRTGYAQILEGHPAIARIGHPPFGAHVMGTDYWSQADYGSAGENGRAYQILARMLGLETPIEEKLYLPEDREPDPALSGLIDAIPWKEINVMICPASSSRRKEMDPHHWEELAKLMEEAGLGVVQAGTVHDRYIRGAFNLLGLTTPRQAISIMSRFQLVVTVDNFFMHAAHLVGIPAVVIWGPTPACIYGYPDQIHLRAAVDCDHPDGCIGPGRGHLYPTPCPRGADHCIDSIGSERIHRAVLEALGLQPPPSPGPQ